jgi:DNA-binding CsgD family transcriptional regulator
MKELIVVKEDKKTTFFISTRELKIVQSIAEGNTSKEVAIQYDMSHRTVDTIRNTVLRRLDCRNMPHLITTLFRQKILS